ncbi:MAG: hypothetical protein R3B13_04615 [Polyangiaceae bacterium]
MSFKMLVRASCVVTALVAAAGCSATDPGEDDAMEASGDFADPGAASSEDDEEVAQTQQELTSCKTLKRIYCDGSQPSSQTAFTNVCNNYCWYRGWPSCAHTMSRCPAVTDGIIPVTRQVGYGGQCRCRTPGSGVQ